MKRLQGSQAKLLIFSLAVILTCFILPDLSYAEPAVSSDTFYFVPGTDTPASPDGDTLYIPSGGGDVRIQLNLKNDHPINTLGCDLIDRCYDGNIFLDSAKNNGNPLPQCFIGSRTVWTGFDTHILNLTCYPPEFMISALAMMAIHLMPGDGPIAFFTFTANDTGSVCLDTIRNLLDPPVFCVHVEKWIPEFISRSFYVRSGPYNPGDVNCDRNVDVTDAFSLINYLFRGGEEPCSLESGDVNCDQRVSVSDVVYLIRYLFRNGPPPQECEY
jgi:hypothetical protein